MLATPHLPASLSRRLATAGSALLLTVTAAGAQAPAAPPPGWVVRADAGGMDMGDGDKVVMAAMKPGFHVTTGPAAILFDSTMKATGDWRLEATLHLFDPGARAEGFGVFFGGRDLNSAAPHYSYALLRRDGKAMLKVRDGATTRTVRDWAANGAIPTWNGGPAGTSVKYALVVEAKGARVTMWIGATQVLDAPRSELPTDGTIGLRINHALNLHVESVTITPLTAR